MFVLDTNVLSDLMRTHPEPRVVAWTAGLPLGALYTTTVTQAEMLYGVQLLPAGQRRDQMDVAMRALFDEDFAGRILPFDVEAAPLCARIAASRNRDGRPISQSDAQIAAIAAGHDKTLVTRNVLDFDGTGVKIVNPWSA